MDLKNQDSVRPGLNSGFALTELLFTVAIIALVLGAIASIAATQKATQTARKEGMTIEGVVDDLRLILTRNESFSGVNMNLTTDIDLWPDNKVLSRGRVASEWGSDIALSVDSAVDPTQKTVRFDIPGVPSKGCSDLATYSFSASRVSVDGLIIYNTIPGSPSVYPTDVASAATQCQSEPSTVSVWFPKQDL